MAHLDLRGQNHFYGLLRIEKATGSYMLATKTGIRLRSALVGTAFYLHPCDAPNDASLQAVADMTLEYARLTMFSSYVQDYVEAFSKRNMYHINADPRRRNERQGWIEKKPYERSSCRRCLASGQDLQRGRLRRRWTSIPLHEWRDSGCGIRPRRIGSRTSAQT